MENKKFRIWLIISIAFILFLFQQAASYLGIKAADLFNYGSFDKDNVFAWISVHHIVQMAAALIVIFVISKLFHFDFRFRIGDYKKGLRYVAIYYLIILAYIIIPYVIDYTVGTVSPYYYPLNAVNVSGMLCFQFFISGTEEILFRALPVTVLAYFLKNRKHLKLGKLNLPIEIIITSFLFSIAHINYTLHPFTLNYDPIQLVFAFVVGTIQGITYVKCNSILYPLLMHSLCNVTYGIVGYSFAVLM